MIFDFCMVFNVTTNVDVLSERTLIIISVLRSLGLVAKVYRGNHGGYIYVLIRRKYVDTLSHRLSNTQYQSDLVLSKDAHCKSSNRKGFQNILNNQECCIYNENLVSESARLKSTHHLIESMTDDGQRIKLRYYIVRKKIITACFPLHDMPKLHELRLSCLRLWSIPWGLPLVQMKVINKIYFKYMYKYGINIFH